MLMNRFTTRSLLRRSKLLILLLAWLSFVTPFSWSAEQSWTLNFKETEIQELIKFVADATGKTVVIDPQVKGKVKVISSKPVTATELYELFLSILEVHGFAAIDSGNVVRVVPVKDARTLSNRVVESSRSSDSAEIVTHVMQLENISATKLIPILRPLVPQQSHMAAYAPSNAIIISDTAANISRIRQVIKQVDQIAVEETEVITLQYASAEEMVRVLKEITGKGPGKPGDAEASPLTLVADKRTNRVLVSGDELQRQRIRTLLKRLDAPAQQSGNSRVIYLEYANAENLAKILSQVVQNMAKLGPAKAQQQQVNATIEADEETNALIVTAEDDVRQTLEAIVSRLDIRRAQVLVEAIIVEILANDDNELGIEWLFKNKHDVFGGFTDSATILDDIAAPIFDDPGSELGLPPVTERGGQFLGKIRRNEDGTNFAVLISALDEDVNSNILSTPSLLTLDNSSALINVGQEVPFITGSFSSVGDSNNPNNPFQTIERENVGVKLEVTPHINEGDSVVMELVQEVSSLTGVEASDIITNERRIESTVVAKDGEIIVLGGLIEDEVQDDVSKVPLLGDIPWLGRLFRNSKTTVVKKNLMVFIRPTIIREDEVLAGATAEKYRYIRDQQLQRREEGVDLIDDETLPLLPEWEEQLRKMRLLPEAASEAAVDSGQE
jgi:general secretion pathway protein D